MHGEERRKRLLVPPAETLEQSLVLLALLAHWRCLTRNDGCDRSHCRAARCPGEQINRAALHSCHKTTPDNDLRGFSAYFLLSGIFKKHLVGTWPAGMTEPLVEDDRDEPQVEAIVSA